MKNISFFLLIIVFPVAMFGQRGYYFTDSCKSFNAKLINGGDLMNSRFCQVKEGDSVVKYTPYEVKEYGFNGEWVFISKELRLFDSVQRVFLQRVVTGKTTLYYYKGEGISTYFVERDSTLFKELPRPDGKTEKISFENNLRSVTSDCPAMADAIKLVTYNKRLLSKFFDRYNTCDLKPFPFFKYGIILGYGSTKLFSSSAIPNIYVKELNFKYTGNFAAGFFIDKPVFASDFSLHTELYYSKNGYSVTQRIENKDVDFVANTSTVNLPILVRYSYPSLKIRPFINAGLQYACNLKNDNIIYTATVNQSVIEIDNISEPAIISKNLIGYTIGTGLEYKLNYKKSLFFELRYNKLYSSSKTLNNSEFHILTGINF